MKEKSRITLPKLKQPRFQDYILYIDSTFVECMSNDIDQIVDLILMNRVSIMKIIREYNRYGLTDYAVICK